MLHVTRSECVANFIFFTLSTSEVKLEHWRFNNRNLSVNILNMLPRNMLIMGQNSGGLKAYWEIWFTSGRLLDNQAPRRVKQACQGGIFSSPDLSRLVPPHVISFKYNTSAWRKEKTTTAHLSCFEIQGFICFIFVLSFTPLKYVRLTTVFKSVKDIAWLLNSLSFLWRPSLNARCTQMFSLCSGSLLAELSFSGGIKWLQTLTSFIVSAVWDNILSETQVKTKKDVTSSTVYQPLLLASGSETADYFFAVVRFGQNLSDVRL